MKRERRKRRKNREKKKEKSKKNIRKKTEGKTQRQRETNTKKKKQKGRENDLNSRFKNACLMMEKLCKEQSAPCHRDICGSTCFYEPKHHVNHQCKAIYSPPCR